MKASFIEVYPVAVQFNELDPQQDFEMATRQAACEPCRKAKVACDHMLPCNRCETSGKGESCTYRTRPFKRKHQEMTSRVIETPQYVTRRDDKKSTQVLIMASPS